MEKHVVTLKREKETKNTIRYKEEVGESGKPPVLDSIYVPKWVAGDEQEIRVTIEPNPAAKGTKK